MTSRPLSSRPFVWSVRSTLRHVSTRKHSLLQRLKPRTAPSQGVSLPPPVTPPSPPPSPTVSEPIQPPMSATTETCAPMSCASSLPLLLTSPPRARHHPYQRFTSRSCPPRSPHSDGGGRSFTRSHASTPTLTSSRSSEWLAAYNEAWEDGTGIDVDPLSERHVDYYYVPDTITLAPISNHGTAHQQHCLADAFPAEWFTDTSADAITHQEHITQYSKPHATSDDTSNGQTDDQHSYQHDEQEKMDDTEDSDDAYTSRMLGMAMLGMYCTQGAEEPAAATTATPDEPSPPASSAAIGSPRVPSLPPRTPSSRARSEFNDVNPQLVSRRSSTASSDSPSLSSTPAHLCSPTLSPLTSSPSISTPGFAYSPVSTSPPTNTTFSSNALSATSSSPPTTPPSDAADVNAAVRRQPRPVQFDEDMHRRACERLRSRLVVDGSTLSDKRSTVSSSSSSSSSSTPAVCAIDERAHHDRFIALTNSDGSLCLSAIDLPSLQSWLHLGSFLLSTPRVASLSFHSVSITSAELEMLGHAALSFIRTLSFTDNNIGVRPYTLTKLVDLLAACEQIELERVSITHNSLRSIDALDTIINQHPTLHTLRLSDNAITNEGALLLANAMKRLAATHHFTDLSLLALDGNRIDGQGVSALMSARDELHSVTGMDVEVVVTGMREYTPPLVARGGMGGAMSPLALLPLRPLAFPAALSLDAARVAVMSQTAQRRLTAFRTLSLKVIQSQSSGRQVETQVEGDRS